MSETICAILPIKSLDGVKSRLSESLSLDQRSELVRAMAEDVLGLLDELTIRRVLVIGEGMGALQALRLAYDAPARIACVLAVAPFARPASLDELYAPFAETVRLARADG